MSKSKAGCCGNLDPHYKVGYNAETQEAYLYCVECSTPASPAHVSPEGYASVSATIQVQREVNAYVSMLQELGFSQYHTGGGCMTMRVSCPDGQHYIFVSNDDFNVPQDGEPVTCGLFREDDDDCQTVEEAEGELSVGDLRALMEQWLTRYK